MALNLINSDEIEIEQSSDNLCFKLTDNAKSKIKNDIIVNSLDSDSTTNSPSVHATKDYVDTGDLEVYSTEEKVVGTWIDDKPIYRKVVDCGYLPNNATKNIPSGITNADNIVRIYGIADEGTYCMPVPQANPNSPYSILISVYKTGDIHLITGIDRSTTKCYAIIEYTKTTD